MSDSEIYYVILRATSPKPAPASISPCLSREPVLWCKQDTKKGKRNRQNLFSNCHYCTSKAGEEIKQRRAVRPAEIRSQLKSSEGAQT